MAKATKDRRTSSGAKSRKTKQRKVKRYSKLRTELQELEVLPVSAEGAVKSEVVDPSSQGEQHMPRLIQQAMTGWSVPPMKQPRLVNELVGIVEADSEMEGAPSHVVKVMAFNALVKGHSLQHEIDHPELRNGKGTEVNVKVENNVINWNAMFQGNEQVPDEIEGKLREVESEQPRSETVGKDGGGETPS